MCSLSARRVQRTVLCEDLLLAHLLLRAVLRVAHVDERHEPVQMPLLALKRDLMGDHPIIDDFRRDDFIIRPPLSSFGKGSGRHGGVNIGIDRFPKLRRNGGIDIGVHILRQCHAPDIVDLLLFGLRLSGQIGLVPL